MGKRSKLSKEQEAEYREAFNMFDKDGNGNISAEELRQVLKEMGAEPSDSELKIMMQQVDTDGNGEIEFEEFCEMMAMIPHDKDRDLRVAFETFDKDGNGFIDKDELKLVMNQMGESLSSTQIEAMMKEADINGDGLIDFKEFKKMMEK